MRKTDTVDANQSAALIGNILDRLGVRSDEAVSLDDCLAALAKIRQEKAATAGSIERSLVERIERLRAGLTTVESKQAMMRQLLEQMTAPPHFPAIFLAPAALPDGLGALVQTGNERRVVTVGEGVDLDEMAAGDEVLLSNERNCLLGKVECRAFPAGEVATYSRRTPDGRLVLKTRDEEIVVLATAVLRAGEMKSGDLVRIDRSMGLAFEKIEPAQGRDYFFEGTPSDTFDDVGGLERELESLKETLTLATTHRSTAAKYGLRGKKSVLFVGKPGNGKTMVARAACSFLAGLSRAGRSHFVSIKPGALNSMWFGETEHQYREVFSAARRVAAEDPDVPVVMFWDEVDAIGSSRGESAHRLDDKMLNSFMAELDGLEDRGNIIILAATNRLDALDPALVRPGRLGDLVLNFPTPNRRAARSILAKHMPGNIPYAANGEGPAAAREALLDAAISRLFSETPETELANLLLRDGKRRVVTARDLISGAHLGAIAQAAIERGCLREVRGGSEGITEADIHASIADFFVSVPRAITPNSARHYLSDLPQDIDVVRVEVIERRVRNPHRYHLEAA